VKFEADRMREMDFRLSHSHPAWRSPEENAAQLARFLDVPDETARNRRDRISVQRLRSMTRCPPMTRSNIFARILRGEIPNETVLETRIRWSFATSVRRRRCMCW
jgi:hypothetical protein